MPMFAAWAAVSHNEFCYQAEKSKRVCLLLSAGLRPLGAVLGTGLHTLGNALGVQGAADDVITHAGQVAHTAATDHHHAVLLQVVAHTGDVSRDFDPVGKPDSGDLTQSGVRLFGDVPSEWENASTSELLRTL